MSEENVNMSLGNMLKNAREKKNLSIKDVEINTKIRYRYLRALEEDNLAIMPGPVYTKGFIKSYCKLVDLNPDPLLELFTVYLEEHTSKEKEEPLTFSKVNKKKSNTLFNKVILLGIIFSLLFCFQYIYIYYFKPPVNNTTALTTTPKVKDIPESKPEIIEKPISIVPKQIDINFTIADITPKTDKCWVQVKADEKIIFEGTLTEGDSKSFIAKEKIFFILGDSGVTKITINGRDYGMLGKIGQSVRQEYSLEQLNNQIN